MSTVKKILTFNLSSPIGVVIIVLVIGGLKLMGNYNDPRNYCIRSLSTEDKIIYNKMIEASKKYKNEKKFWERSAEILIRDCVRKNGGF